MKHKFILSARSSLPSARILRDALKELFDLNLLVTCNTMKLKRNPEIRYGNPEIVFASGFPGLNHYDFIQLLSNKKYFSDKIKDKVYTPVFVSSIPEEKDFPIIIRRYLSSCKGKGIVVCENLDDYRKKVCTGDHWTHFVNLSFELRIHMVGGIPVKIFKKVWTGEEEEDKYPIRTMENYHFSLVDNSKYPKLDSVISTLNEILGTNNFYALDIGWDRNKKEYFVLEANSAPGLNELTAKYYAEFIHGQLEKEV